MIDRYEHNTRAFYGLMRASLDDDLKVLCDDHMNLDQLLLLQIIRLLKRQ